MATPTIKPHQVAESFVAVPGVIVEMVNGIVSPSAVAVDSGWTDILSDTFIAPVAGLYKLTWTGSCFTDGGSGNYRASFRANFDSGDQLITDSTAKIVVHTAEERMYYTVQLQVELTAGSHEVAAQWLATSGTGVLTANTDDTVHLVGQLASGSGAGGILPQEFKFDDGTNHTITSSSWTQVKDATGTGDNVQVSVTVTEGERVMVMGKAQWYCVTSGTIYLGVGIDGADPVDPYILTFAGINNENVVTPLAFLTPPLSAGTHTIGLFGQLGAGPTQLVVRGDATVETFIQAVVYRGGLVPVERDGTIVHSTPRALNFTGASLQVSESNDVVDIGLSDAVTAPGDLIVLTDGPPGSSLLINSGSDHQIMPETGSLSFEAQVNGTYMILFSGELIAPSSNSSCQIKLVFDEGESYEQTVGYNESWAARPTTGNYTEPVFKDQVALTAGTHTVKAYGKITEGTSVQITEGNVHPLVLTLQAILGSGAGGVLVASDSLSADYAVTGDRPSSLVAVPGLSLTINTTPGEPVRLNCSGFMQVTGIDSCTLKFAVDGTAIRTEEVFTETMDSASFVASADFEEFFVATLAQHTITLLAADNSQRTSLKQGLVISAWQYRGGLVPIRNSGVQVVDKPAALNFQGALEVQNASGVANIRMPDAITAPGQIRTLTEGQPSSTINFDDTETQLYPESGTDSFTTTVAGAHRVDLNLPIAGNGVDFNTYQFRVVFDHGLSSEVSIGYDEEWRVRCNNEQWSDPSFCGNVDLAAKTYTVQVFGQRIDGTGNAKIPGSSISNSAVSVLVTAVTGSGAAGMLKEVFTLSGNSGNIDSVTMVPIPSPGPMTLTFEATANEVVEVGFTAKLIATQTDNTVYFQMKLDGVEVGPAPAVVIETNGYTDTLSTSIPVQVTAGSHTLELFGASGNSLDFYVLSGSILYVEQYRGGLVPVTDGFTTVDKPTSQKFVNASVTDDAGQAVVTLPEAVTVPGDIIEVTEPQRTSDLDISTSYVQCFPVTGAAPFTVLQSGTYEAVLEFVTYAASGWNNARYKLVFDEGETNEQTLGDNYGWQSAASDNQHLTSVFRGMVELTSGAHTVKAYGLKTNGTGLIRFQGSSNYTHAPKVTLTAITGSGAQGTIVHKDQLTGPTATVDDNYVVEPSPNYFEVLSVTFNGHEGENVLAAVHAWWRQIGSGNLHAYGFLLLNDVPRTQVRDKRTADGANGDMSHAQMIGPCVQGSNTVKFVVAKHNTSDADFNITAEPASPTTNFPELTVTQFRGGLVPHKNDNVLVQDKPVAVNYLGPGLQATNVNGAVHISANSATEGLEIEETGYTYGPISLTNAEQVLLSKDVTVSEGETVLVFVVFTVRCYSGNAWMNVRLRDGGLTGTELCRYNIQPFSGNSDNMNASFSWPAVGLSAGTHTLAVTVDPNSNYTEAYAYQMSVARVRGGYVVPENVPVFARDASDTSLINATAAVGASSEMRLALNDGVRRRAALPLTCDLDTTGAGGRESTEAVPAVGDLYHLFAVPTTSDDSLIALVASKDAIPGTDGPASFLAYKYLWTVRVESIGPVVVEEFLQAGDWYQPLAGNLAAYTLDQYDGGNPSSGSWVDLTSSLQALIPEGADSIEVQGWMSSSGAQYVFIAGEASPSWTPSTSQPYTQRFIGLGAATPKGQQTRILATPNRELSVQYSVTDATWSALQLGGYRNALYPGAGRGAAQQTDYDPDTPPPRGTWVDTTHVDFAAWPGHGSTLRLALSDGKTRIASGTLGVDTNNGVADLGYDDASSQGNSKWLYFYAVPKTGDDDQFTIVMSDNDPATGPLGRSASKYLWSTYINGSAELLQVYQNGAEFFTPVRRSMLSSSGDVSRTDLDISAYVPLTAGSVIALAEASNGTLYMWPEGDGGTTDGVQVSNTSGNAQTFFTLPVKQHPAKLTYRAINTPSAFWVATLGWIDVYLEVDAGIGVAVGGGGGTESPLTSKGDLYTYSDENDRLPVGTNGHVLTADSGEDTGIKWAAISHPTQAYLREEAFSTTGTDTPGDPESHVIAATPRAAGTTSGYDVQCFRNGVKMKNVASLSTSYDEFTFTVGTLTVAVLASGDADEYDVSFRS